MIASPVFCACGCERPAPIAKQTRRGHVMGQAVRFVLGHNSRGRFGPHRRRDAAERFWSKVAKAAGDACWLWMGSLNSGYGQFSINGRMRLAHRTALEFVHGQIHTGLKVLHSCDVPRCVRPSHLFVDTQIKNIADMVAKGRQARGERNGHAELTTVQVLEIRSRRAAGESLASLALAFGVAPQTISEIALGRRWAHLPLSAGAA